MNGLLDGCVVLVSGVGPGLGHTMAVTFARQGADVVLAARREENLAAAAADVQALGRRAVWQSTDFTDATACDALVARAVEELGGLDAVVNNGHRGGNRHPLMTSDLADWRAAMDVNLFGSLTMTKACVPALRQRGGGRVVMVSTMATRDPRPGQGPYAVSKAALNMAVRTLATELGPEGIRVNGLVPGWIWGPAAQTAIGWMAEERGVTFDVVRDELAEGTCIKRIPTEEEIAGCAVFLASELSAPVTGHLLDANGGFRV